MRKSIENNILTIYPEGRIDSNNAPVVEAEMKAIREENSHDQLVLDLKDTQYLSSAGLRIILRARKAERQLKIINVSSEVYEILEMTGFTEMIPVSKAYRQLSMDGCEVIGEGSNGIVYRYTDDIIVKVYKNNDAIEDIHRERELARTALISGVNTAIPYDVVQVGDKYGSVFELLSAKSLTKLIKSDPENADKYIHIFADMLKEIHGTEMQHGTLPSVKESYLQYADFLKDHLDAAHIQKLKQLIEAVPESDHLIHGDYHTNNVHYANNEAILIDMDTLATGDPVFEFASVYNAYKGFNMLDPKSTEKFLKMDAGLCDYVYEKLLEFYFGTESAEEIQKHADAYKLLGLTRLLRRTIRRMPDRKEDIQMLKDELTALIDQVDSLV